MDELLYDADCGFCIRSAHWPARRGAAVRPTHEVDLVALGVDEDHALREVPFHHDGRVTRGSAAIADARNRYRRPGSTAACALPRS